MEGQKLEIIGANGFPQRSFIWIAAIKAVVGGINIFGDDFHLWMAEDKESEEIDPRGKWLLALKQTEASSLNMKSVKFTEEYLQFYQEALKQIKHQPS